jgi:hypothetical protein
VISPGREDVYHKWQHAVQAAPFARHIGEIGRDEERWPRGVLPDGM